MSRVLNAHDSIDISDKGQISVHPWGINSAERVEDTRVVEGLVGWVEMDV